jgi:hypothetical protein
MTLAELQEKLLSWATAEPRTEDLLAARRAHFEQYGEPHEEDRTFEVRQNGALDAYLYDWCSPSSGSTLERFVASEGGALSPEELGAFRDLEKNVHGLFEVRKIKDGVVRLRDVFAGGDHDVTERRQVAGLAKGDLLEARLLPFQGALYFSGAFLYHPPEARKAILAEVKRLRKEGARSGAAPDVGAFLGLLSRMAFKLERYRNVRFEQIYDFTPGEARTATPRPAK